MTSATLATRIAAAGSLVALMAFTHAAHAVVVVSPASNIAIPVTTAGIYINVLTGATGTAAATTGWDVNPWGSGSLFIYSPSTGGGGIVTTTGVASLPVGSVVGSATASFSTNPGAASAASGWTLNALNYFGFRFLSEADNQVHYGYGTVRLGTSFTGTDRTLVNLYYESVANAPITVTAVPEPGTWALMLGGLAAAGAVVRRRRTAA